MIVFDVALPNVNAIVELVPFPPAEVYVIVIGHVVFPLDVPTPDWQVPSVVLNVPLVILVGRGLGVEL